MESNVTEGGIHRLYIANVSRQTQCVYYRLDHNRKGEMMDINRRFTAPRSQTILPGQQVKIGNDFHMVQITEIVEQLERYGLIAQLDVNNRLMRRVHPYIYNIDRPVTAEAMKLVKMHNDGILIEQGRKRRQDAAVASNDAVTKAVQAQFTEAGIPGEPVPAKTEVTFEQEEQSDFGEKRVEEGYRNDPDAVQASGRNGRGRRNRGR